MDTFTTWELLHSLLFIGWTITPFRRGLKWEPVCVSADAVPTTVYYQPRGFHVDHYYLKCLLMVKDFLPTGLQRIDHGQKQQYYKSLLAMLDEIKNGGTQSLVDDSRVFVALNPAAEEDTPGGANNVDDLDFSSSGADDSSDVGDEGVAPAASSSDLDGGEKTSVELAHSTGSTKWGPFIFLNVTRCRVVKGQEQMVHQVQCTCPFHRDQADKKGTHCTRTVHVPPGVDGHTKVYLALKRWCLDGRLCVHRAVTGAERHLSHKFLEFVDGATEDDWELNAQLRANMQEPEWIVADTAVHPVKADATDATEYQEPAIPVS